MFMNCCCRLIISSNYLECEIAGMENAKQLGKGSFTLPDKFALLQVGDLLAVEESLDYNLFQKIWEQNGETITRENAVLALPGNRLI